MAGAISALNKRKTGAAHAATNESTWVRVTLISVALTFLALFLFLPLVIVFTEAFAKGAQVYFAAITEPAAAHAIKLTLIAAGIAVPCNVIFGLAASRATRRCRP